jgi:hypothetical protein
MKKQLILQKMMRSKFVILIRLSMILFVFISCKSYRDLLPFVEYVDLKEDKTSVEINVKSLDDLSIWVKDSTGRGVYVQFRNGEPSIFSQSKNDQMNGCIVTMKDGDFYQVGKYFSGNFPPEYPEECKNDSIPFRASVPYGKFIFFINDSIVQEDFGWGEVLNKYDCGIKDSIRGR